MLVLGLKERRRQDEVIILLPDGRQIVVSLQMVDRGRARLGFRAPADVRIHRRRVLERVEATTEPPTAAAPEP